MSRRTCASLRSSSARSARSTRATGSAAGEDGATWRPVSAASPASPSTRAILVAVASEGCRSRAMSLEIVEWSTPDRAASCRCDIRRSLSCHLSQRPKGSASNRISVRLPRHAIRSHQGHGACDSRLAAHIAAGHQHTRGHDPGRPRSPWEANDPGSDRPRRGRLRGRRGWSTSRRSRRLRRGILATPSESSGEEAGAEDAIVSRGTTWRPDLDLADGQADGDGFARTIATTSSIGMASPSASSSAARSAPNRSAAVPAGSGRWSTSTGASMTPFSRTRR